MSPLAAPLPSDPAVRVSAAQATPCQLALALAEAMQVLRVHFPTLDFSAWANAALELQADLWVASEYEAYYDDEALAQLILHLEVYAPEPPANLPRYPNQACYLARRFINYQDQAIDALREIEANPLTYGGRVVDLVCGLAAGNGIAHEVYRATNLARFERPSYRRDPAPARAAVAGRVQALHQARGTGLSGLLSRLAS